jgi:hypothetical protein
LDRRQGCRRVLGWEGENDEGNNGVSQNNAIRFLQTVSDTNLIHFRCKLVIWIIGRRRGHRFDEEIFKIVKKLFGALEKLR